MCELLPLGGVERSMPCVVITSLGLCPQEPPQEPVSRVSLMNNIWTDVLLGPNHRTKGKERADHDSEAPAPVFQEPISRFNLPPHFGSCVPGGAGSGSARQVWEARAGRSHRCAQNNRYSALITRLLVKNHLEKGESGPAPALLSINHSAASTSQPSILEDRDGHYFN